MDYIGQDWGSFVSVLGLLVSAVGLALAVWHARKARSAAEAAEAASLEARQAVRRTLSMIDLQKALGMVERLKGMLFDRRLDYGREHYNYLRVTLGEIRAALPAEGARTIQAAITVLNGVENRLAIALASDTNVEEFEALYQDLNSIQNSLVTLASSMMFAEDGAGE